MANNSKTAILILAAGRSSRLGRPKQLIEIDGETLLHRIARRAVASKATNVLVVLGHEANTMQRGLNDLEIETVHNPDWHRGIGTSIRAGVRALAEHDAILISVCDQPHLTSDVFNQLIAAIPNSSSGIVASSYSDTLGVPAIFSSQHFPSLVALPDDAGAKVLFANDVDSINFPGGSIDIDMPDDLANI